MWNDWLDNIVVLKDIPKYEGLYAVTKDGKVWSYPKKYRPYGKWLKPIIEKTGYISYNLRSNCYSRRKKAHRLVMETYNPTDNINLEVDHIDSNKLNNNLENLQWVTHSQNVQFSHTRGNRKNVKYSKGINKYNAILNYKKASNIRKLRKKGMYIKDLSKKFCVSQSCIKNVLYRGDWNVE